MQSARAQVLAQRLEQGALAPPIGARYPLDAVDEALTKIDERRALGKVTLTVR